MRHITRTRILLLLIALALIPLGFALKWYGNAWLADSFGGAVYEMFFIVLFASCWPTHPAVGRIAMIVLIVTCGLEVMQLWHPPVLESVRATMIGRALLGNTFAGSDFIYYVVGTLLGWSGVRGLLVLGAAGDRA